MDAMSRREFFRKTGADAALVGLLAAGAATLRANPLGLPIGSQTYPHRAFIKDGNFAGLAAALAALGVKTLELCSPLGYTEFSSLSDARMVKEILADHGLACESAHFSMKELREKQPASIEWAKEIGLTRPQSIQPGLDRQGQFRQPAEQVEVAPERQLDSRPQHLVRRGRHQ